jgi:hypothetical protein
MSRTIVAPRSALLLALIASAAGPAQAQAPDKVEEIVVKARRLDAARSRIQPGLGATVTEFSASTLARVAQGSNAPLNTRRRRG